MPGAMTHLVLVEPLSFMNESGGPVKALMSFYGVGPERLVVVHDELDIPFTAIRVKHGGGDNGHNGLKSIRKALGHRGLLPDPGRHRPAARAAGPGRLRAEAVRVGRAHGAARGGPAGSRRGRVARHRRPRDSRRTASTPDFRFSRIPGETGEDGPAEGPDRRFVPDSGRNGWMPCTAPMPSSPATSPRRPAGCCSTCARPSARSTTRTPPTPCASRPTAASHELHHGAAHRRPARRRHPQRGGQGRRRRGCPPSACGSSTRSTAPTSTARAAPTSPCTSRCGSRPAAILSACTVDLPAQGLTRSVLDDVERARGLPTDRPVRIVASRSRPPATLGATVELLAAARWPRPASPTRASRSSTSAPWARRSTRSCRAARRPTSTTPASTSGTSPRPTASPATTGWCRRTSTARR